MQSVAPKNRHIAILTKAFLHVHWDRQKPLLLGYSGGPDSKALLYSLLECGVRPLIAHVDHGWREESAQEAARIQEEAEKLGCPFFTTRLDPKERSEDEARKGRYAFFAKIWSQESPAALLLAHQAEDLAETVLKRVLEGAHIARISGMQEVSSQHGMDIWRPMLKIGKADILQFLEERQLEALNDASNSDPNYLRARMRAGIFPYLNEQFGKETKENLILLSERALELKKYLDKRIENVPLQKGPWGTLVDLRGLEIVEQRHLLQNMLRLNRDQLATILAWVQSGAKSKELDLKTKKILVDGGRVWINS